MKFWTSEHVFDHDWTTVVTAALNKYPNPVSPSVIGCDVIGRTISPSGVIQSHRLLLADWAIAPALNRIFKFNELGYASEHSTIDVRRRVMSARTRNLTLNRFINIEERLEYTQHPTDSSKTLLKQEATINVERVPLTSYVETLVAKTINANATKGRLAMEWVIHKMGTVPTPEPTEQLA
ncbi:unnamed protein product [Rotaria magnacalcarata]|nr:unnamed protein product [Rotaria magnacalcarata]CAF1605878.1 unnamed protein product [Rotaria magnacalcarata]CAF2062210.1 unnamed protein product [Rotaria magnacalcarata]CAF2142242.1 unnamed protein product [Rotaria magnacalcarata]CAF2230401.1 unnamed protein product [Rotaria magnacalcarata]